MENCESRSSISSFRGGGVILVLDPSRVDTDNQNRRRGYYITIEINEWTTRSWNVSRTLFALINSSSLTVSMSGIMRDIPVGLSFLYIYIYAVFLSFCFFFLLFFFCWCVHAYYFRARNYLITLNNVTDHRSTIFNFLRNVIPRWPTYDIFPRLCMNDCFDNTKFKLEIVSMRQESNSNISIGTF